MPLTPASPAPDTDARARRNVIVLVLATAILGAQMPMIFIMAGLAGQSLSPNPCWATMPITAAVLGSMLSAQPLSGMMTRFGRAAGFLSGTAAGAIGAGIAAYALQVQSFGLFLVGSLLTGVYMSAQGFYRFAAADTASPAFLPKAISWVMAGGLVSAIIGPQLVKLTADAMAVPFLGAYLTVIAINILGAGLFFLLDIPRPAATAAGGDTGRTRGQLLRDPVIAVAMICAMVSYALMNLVMTSTPLAVVGCGYASPMPPISSRRMSLPCSRRRSSPETSSPASARPGSSAPGCSSLQARESSP